MAEDKEVYYFKRLVAFSGMESCFYIPHRNLVLDFEGEVTPENCSLITEGDILEKAKLMEDGDAFFLNIKKLQYNGAKLDALIDKMKILPTLGRTSRIKDEILKNINNIINELLEKSENPYSPQRDIKYS